MIGSLHPKKIMRLTLIISFFAHLSLILIFRNAFPFHWDKTDLRTYQVELIRPPTDGINPEEMAKAELDSLKQEPAPEEPKNEETEETISLDTKDKRYVNYTGLIKKSISQQMGKYPAEARENLMEGMVHLKFSVTKNGELLDVQILESSGFQVLDQESMRRIQAAAPFPPFPEQISGQKRNFTVHFVYRLNIK